MSRRRPTTPAPLARRFDGRNKGITPYGYRARVEVVDPAGHRLVEFHRLLRDTDPEQTSWVRDSVGPSIQFEPQSDDAGKWLMLWFRCKTCRDQGLPDVSSVPYPRVLDAVTSLWERCAADDTPRRSQIRTNPL